MATNSRRDVTLGIGVETSGEENIKSLAATVRSLGKEGDPAAAGFVNLAAALETAATETRQFEQAERAAAAALSADRTALAEKRDGLARLKLTTDDAGRATDEYKAKVKAEQLALIDGRTAVRDKTAALAAATAATRQAAAAEQQLVAQAQTVTEAFKKQTTAVTASGTALSSSSDAIAQGFGRLGAAAAAAFTGREFIDTINQAEGLKRGLEAVTGGSKEAAEVLAYLKTTSNALGLEVQSAGKAFLSLTAATQGTALAGQPTREIFEAVSRAMSTLGKSGAETERALQAVAQMASKGAVSMEELRGQLGEALPGALKAAADGAGLTTAQLITMVESGNLLAKDLLPALTKGLNDLYANGGPPDTLNANWARLRNTITETAVALGEGGVGKGLTKAAGGAAVALAATSEAVSLVGSSLGEYAGALATGNFRLGTFAERSAAADAKLNALAQTAGLAAPEVTKIGTAADEAGRKARDAFNQFERSAQTATERGTTFGATVVDLAAKFDALRAKGDSAAEAIAKIGKDFDLTTAKGIVQAEDTLNRLRLNGQATAQEISEAWRIALTGIDLAEFEARARAAFAGSAGEARKLKDVTDAIGGESLRRAGTSLLELTTGFSTAATTAIHDVDALAKTLLDLGIKSDEAGRSLAGAVDKALAAANTERAVQALIDRLLEAGKQGLISGDQMAEGLQRARDKADALKAGINSLDEALKSFGLKSRADLQATADKLTESWQKISSSTTVSLADQRAAFDQWSKAVIAANGGVESEAVRVARAMLEIKEAADRAGKGITDNAKAGGSALDDLAGRAGRTADAINRVASASGSIDANNRRSTTSPNDASQQIGNGTNGGFGSLGAGANLNIPEGFKFDQAAYERALSAYFSSGLTSAPGIAAPDPQKYVVANPSLGSGTRQPGNGTGAGQSLYGPKPTAAPASTSHTVTVTINGTAQTVNAASAADAKALVAMMQRLESAARSSGTQVQT